MHQHTPRRILFVALSIYIYIRTYIRTIRRRRNITREGVIAIVLCMARIRVSPVTRRDGGHARQQIQKTGLR